jgi:hypothetical protein
MKRLIKQTILVFLLSLAKAKFFLKLKNLSTNQVKDCTFNMKGNRNLEFCNPGCNAVTKMIGPKDNNETWIINDDAYERIDTFDKLLNYINPFSNTKDVISGHQGLVQL